MLENESLLVVDSIRLIADLFSSLPAWSYKLPFHCIFHLDLLPTNEAQYFLACDWMNHFPAPSALLPITVLSTWESFESNGHGLRMGQAWRARFAWANQANFDKA